MNRRQPQPYKAAVREFEAEVIREMTFKGLKILGHYITLKVLAPLRVARRGIENLAYNAVELGLSLFYNPDSDYPGNPKGIPED